jgi:hypothetical protein
MLFRSDFGVQIGVLLPCFSGTTSKQVAYIDAMTNSCCLTYEFVVDI